jgi:hypothetical protein
MDTDKRVLKAWGRGWGWVVNGGKMGTYVILSTIKNY